MSVKVQRNALRKFLRKTLFEMDNTQYDMANANQKHQDKSPLGDEDVETTIPHEVPIEPAEMMATQLVDQRPPIEDDDFVPDNVGELSRAADALARMVPSDKVAVVYKELQRVVDSAIDDHNNPDSEKSPGSKNVDSMVQEENLRRAIRTVLKETSRWGDDDEYSSGYSIEDTEPDYAAMDDPPVNNEPDGVGLDKLAGEHGYSGASGVRQDIERMTQRMRFVAEEVGVKEIEALRTFAVQEFIDVMLTNEYIDEEDVVELQQTPAVVADLDSFRFFFVAAFVLPAYQEVKRTGRKAAEAELAKLDIPQKAHQTIMNQALGETPESMPKLEKKVMKVAMAAGEDADEIDKMVDRLKKGYAQVKKAVSSGDAGKDADFQRLAKEKWAKQSKGRKAKVLAQALGETASFQDDIQK